MKTKHIQVRVGWPTLPEVVQELALKLSSDDWVRYSTEDEKTFYYIVGYKAWTADNEGEDFPTQSIPIPNHVSPVREAEVDAPVAASKPMHHYVDRRRHLEGHIIVRHGKRRTIGAWSHLRPIGIAQFPAARIGPGGHVGKQH